jgi:hypothetical protein
MRIIFRTSLLVSVAFIFCLTAVAAQAEPLEFTSSTQYLWGDDLLGESQSVIAQYLRFGYNPPEKKFSLTGYGRLWQDLESGGIRDDDFNTRLYYLYLDYSPIENISTRLGRQFVNFTAGTSIMDGATVDIHKMGPFGLTLAGGWDVRFSLDSEEWKSGNYFVGMDVHLEDVRSTQLGISYVRRYDESELAREEFGMNFRYFFKRLSPYAELKYDRLTETIDEAVAGIDFFPITNLMVKAEFYHSYPIFDSTSIYSVFAVEKFREYLVRAEYALPVPVTLIAQYSLQEYEDAEDADVYSIGARIYPIDGLTVNASFDYRDGYSGYNGFTGDTDGELYGFEIYGDYRVMKTLAVFAGVQYDKFDRPEESGDNHARRYWAGGRWLATEDVALTARIEDNVNENFEHRPLGRVTLDWKL